MEREYYVLKIDVNIKYILLMTKQMDLEKKLMSMEIIVI